MPRYTPRRLEFFQEQYDSLPVTMRQLVDRRIEELLEDPTGNPYATYDEQFDQWSVPVGPNGGLILYAVVREAAQVILLRLVPGLG